MYARRPFTCRAFPAQPQLPDKKGIAGNKLTASRDRLLEFFSAAGGAAMGRGFAFAKGDDGKNTWGGRERVMYRVAHELHRPGQAGSALRQF